ncbi:MAG: DNA-3-methyladenine glycosylase [Bacteroidales bacterium]|jgi:DNA-3-methyladenine glycosylase|nr:DNA-3-methyladenine glycosylase [Bacteroidales bacterium]
MPVVQNEWFGGNDVVKIAREMIGMEIFSQMSEGVVSGIITETEAYAGVEDRASHAWNNRRTPRTEIMYREGGTLYIYLCYGIHSLLNIVTNQTDIPHAVLIRGLIPKSGQDMMLKHLKWKRFKSSDLYGPGNVAKALGMHHSDSGMILNKMSEQTGKKVWIEQADSAKLTDHIIVGTRIGVNYAGKDALLPYRFMLDQNKIK